MCGRDRLGARDRGWSDPLGRRRRRRDDHQRDRSPRRGRPGGGSGGGHHLRDRRTGCQVHPPDGAGDHRRGDERGLLGGYRIFHRGAGVAPVPGQGCRRVVRAGPGRGAGCLPRPALLGVHGRGDRAGQGRRRADLRAGRGNLRQRDSELHEPREGLPRHRQEDFLPGHAVLLDGACGSRGAADRPRGGGAPGAGAHGRAGHSPAGAQARQRRSAPGSAAGRVPRREGGEPRGVRLHEHQGLQRAGKPLPDRPAARALSGRGPSVLLGRRLLAV